MNKKEKTIYTAAVIEDLLDKSLEITGNPDECFKLIKTDPSDVLFMRKGEQRNIASMIYVCLQTIEFAAMEVRYTQNGFKIKFII